MKSRKLKNRFALFCCPLNYEAHIALLRQKCCGVVSVRQPAVVTSREPEKIGVFPNRFDILYGHSFRCT